MFRNDNTEGFLARQMSVFMVVASALALCLTALTALATAVIANPVLSAGRSALKTPSAPGKGQARVATDRSASNQTSPHQAAPGQSVPQDSVTDPSSTGSANDLSGEAEPQPLPLAGKRVMIDPGHGGTDPGAISGGVHETDVVLAVSLALRDKLEALGATVVMTRETDVFVTLPDRLAASNASCPDVFIAIHANSIFKTQIRGIETYYYDARDEELARTMLSALAKDLKETAKWNHQRNLFVLDGNDAPAALVEIGYLTNPTTRALLKTSTYQDKVAASLAAALSDYLTRPNVALGCPLAQV